METTADELETKDGLLSGCGGGGGDPAASIVGRAQQFYSLLTSSLEVSCNDLMTEALVGQIVMYSGFERGMG